MTDSRSVRGIAAVGIAVLLATCTGCVTTEFFNPEFLSSIGLGSKVSLLPGDAPSVLVEVENNTSRVIEVNLSFVNADGDVQVRPVVIAVGDKYAEAVICPVDEMTLGTLNDSRSIGAIVRLGGGTANDPFVTVDPFGATLVDEVNYNCGDSVTFSVQASSVSTSGYQIFAFVRRAGATP